MNQATRYTPLESLFLFQLLAKFGLVAEAFPRISAELNQNNFINQQESYDAERLSPDKLEQLACRLVREEQVREVEGAEKNGNGAGSSPISRKRKLPSPSAPSIKELQAQRDRLPQLVDRLYATYQADIIRRIREDEAALEKLERDVRELEAPLAAGNNPSQQNLGIPRINGTASPAGQKAIQPVKPNGHISQPSVPTPPPAAQPVAVKPGIVAPTAIRQPPIERKPPQLSPSPNPPGIRPPSEARHATPGARPANFRNSPAPPSGLQHPHPHPHPHPQSHPLSQPHPHPQQANPAYGIAPGSGNPPPVTDGLQRPQVLAKSHSPAPSASPQLQTPGTYKWEQPFSPQQPPYNGQPVSRPPSHPGQPQFGAPQHLHPQYPHNPYGHRQAPQALQQPSRTASPGNVPFQQPVLVPPQGSMQNAGQPPPLPRQGHPTGPVQQSQQYRQQAVAVGSPATSTSIPAPQYVHPQQQFHQAQAATRHPVAPPPQVHTPGRGYAGPTANAHQTPHAAATHLGQPPQAHGPHSLPSTPVPQRPVQQPLVQQTQLGTQPVGGTRQPQRPLSQMSRPSAAFVPPSQPLSQPQTPLSASVPHVVRGHGTKWTSTPTPSTPRLETSGYFDSQSPAYEPLSPTDVPAQLSTSSPQPPGKKDARKNSSKPDTSVPKVPSRLSRSAQKSSIIKESTEDVESGRKIKNEEFTPRPFEDAGDTTADESVHGKAYGASRLTNKRKRHESPVNRAPPAPATHVLWTRSFNKVSASALEQVTSHRHANMFAHPIKARDAPGYPDIILRPQDLKNIRAAINNGQRAASALEKTLPDSDTNAMNIWLPISIDIIPPKGIINIAQLERELVHMFANSIMYNQDPDRGVGPSFVKVDEEDDDEDAVGYEVDENGIVKETRNMFVEVEKLLSDLRSEIERNAQPSTVGRASDSRGVSVAAGDASNVEDDGDQHTGDVETHSTTKRRRKG